MTIQYRINTYVKSLLHLPPHNSTPYTTRPFLYTTMNYPDIIPLYILDLRFSVSILGQNNKEVSMEYALSAKEQMKITTFCYLFIFKKKIYITEQKLKKNCIRKYCHDDRNF